MALCSLAAWTTHAHAQEQVTEDTTARYQSTYNWQYHPSFASPYAGVNSLKGNAESMYTFSATAHWGFRPWQNGELYFNPEVTAGKPFSGNLVGLGSFTNGEITRAGGTTPKLYRQRLYVRHTWGQGGEREGVDPRRQHELRRLIAGQRGGHLRVLGDERLVHHDTLELTGLTAGGLAKFQMAAQFAGIHVGTPGQTIA